MKHISLLSILFFFTSSAFGAGYQLRYQGAESMGTAFASAGSYGSSLSNAYYSPGLFLSQDKKQAASLELMALHPLEAEFTSSTGTRYDDYVSTGISGALFYGYKFNDKTAFTVGLTTPWGTNTDYDSDWEGRYQALKTELVTLNLQPLITRAVSDKLRISIGPQIQQMEGTISSATLTPVPPAAGGPDLVSEFDGDDLAIGFVLAGLYKINNSTSLAFNYTSEVKHTLEGRLNFSPDSVAGLAGANDINNANAEISTPEVITASVSHILSEKIIGHFSASYTKWSVFDNLTLRAGNTPVSVLPQNWQDTYYLAVGGTFKRHENLILRGGLSYETSAVENEDRTPRTQDSDRLGLAFGFSMPIGKLKLDVGLNHIIYLGDIELDIPNDLANGKPGLTGSYDFQATLLRAGLQYSF